MKSGVNRASGMSVRKKAFGAYKWRTTNRANIYSSIVGASSLIRPSRGNLPSVLVIAMEFRGLDLNGYSRIASRDIDVRYLEAFMVEACTVKRV